MNTTSLKRLLDTCFLAKHIVETLPELPKGMKPRHIHVMDAIEETLRLNGMCRVSDVNSKLNITMPSVTKLIQELEAAGMVRKQTDAKDKRVTLLYLTDDGMACVQRHVRKLHGAWADALHDVSDEQAEEVIRIMEELWNTMPGRKDK